jgi:hypothetical protein
MAGLFEKLQPPAPAPSPTKKTTKQSRKRADLVTQWEKDVEIKAFLMDLLAKGPVPAATIQKRGAEQKFTGKQLWRAKRLIGIISFKKGTGFEGRWFWTLPKNAPSTANPRHRYTRSLRDLSKSLGFRLQPIGRQAARR